jgi:hypothetical protein
VSDITGALSGELILDEDDGQDITVKSTALWYPPLPIPIGVVNDNFQGDDNHPLHRGRWIIFLNYNTANAGNHYTNKYCETLTNRAHFKINGDGDAESEDVLISALSRAEVKQPFYVDFQTEIKHAAGQDPRHFYFALCTPDPRDGVIQNSNLYGRILFSLTAYDSFDGHTQAWYAQADDEDVTSWSGDNLWAADTIYRVRAELQSDNGLLRIIVTVYDESDNVIWTTTLSGVSNSRSRTLRAMFTAYTTEDNANYTEFFVDNFRVVRNSSKKAKVIVSIKHGAEWIMASEDVMDFNVSNREGSYPSASLSLKNISHKYHTLNVVDEIEIRAGWDHLLYLLFRGNIDTPEKSFPPSTMNIASNKGFARRLDFLETHGESWIAQKSGDIVKGLIADYFDGVFTADWVETGIQTSLDSDGEMIGSLIQKLADMSGFIVYVDFNRCLHFIAAEDEETQSNLVLNEAKDVLDITNRLIDEIINAVTVNGATDSYTAEDAVSIAANWRRERSFSDESLTSAAAVQSRAEELLAQFKDPFQEIPIKLPEVFMLELFDRVVVNCGEVGLESEEISIKSTNYSFTGSGYRTSINGLHKGFSMAELLADHNRKLAGVT